MLPTRELSELDIPDLEYEGADVTSYALPGGGQLREFHDPSAVAFGELRRISRAPAEVARGLERSLALPQAVVTDAGVPFAIQVASPGENFTLGGRPQRLSYLIHTVGDDDASARIRVLRRLAQLVDALHRLDIVLGAPATDSVLYGGGSGVDCFFGDAFRFRIVGRRPVLGCEAVSTEADRRWLVMTSVRILLSRPDTAPAQLAEPEVYERFGGSLGRYLSWSADGPWPPTAHQWDQALAEHRPDRVRRDRS